MRTGVTLISGPTGAGKSSLLATAAAWAWENHRRISRLYLGDLGGFSDKIGNLVKLGIVEVFKLRTRAGAGGEGLVEETLRQASFGYWPAEINTGTGEVMPGARMLPPVETVWELLCPAGHVVKQAKAQKDLLPQLCPQCKVTTSLQNGTVKPASTIAKHFEKVGLVMFEGLTSLGDWGLTSLADRRARMELRGANSNIGQFTSGSMQLDGNNMSDFGFMQGEAYRWIQNSDAIPGLVRPPIWTALEDLTKDASKWGPSIPGSAATATVPQWVGDWIGAQLVKVEGKAMRRLCLSPFISEDGKLHQYKVRVDGGLPAFLENPDDPTTPDFSEFSLARYFTLADAAAAERYERAKEKYADAPGNAGGIVRYGEAVVQAPAPVVVAQAAAPAPKSPVPPPGVAPPRAAAAPPPVTPAPKLTQPGTGFPVQQPGAKLPPPRVPAPPPQVTGAKKS